jgi:hypothetical protein
VVKKSRSIGASIRAQRISNAAEASPAVDLPNLPLPDFVIAGAPGAGTTFAHESLRQHPGICMPIRKELHHFCPDLDSGSDADGGFFTRTEAEYRSFFSPARPDQRTGEASPWYLYSREAPLLLRAADERIRVIVMLRDPVEIVRYVHSRRVQNGNEDLERLEDALDAEAARRRGERFPAGARNLPGLQYREHGRYATHLAGTWPPSLASSCCSSSSTISLRTPGRCISGLVRHIGPAGDLEPDDLAPSNRRAEVRSRSLQRLLRSRAVAGPVRRLAPVGLRERARLFARRLNSRHAERAEIAPDVRASLRAEFRSDVEWLSGVLGRDLTSIW